MPELPEVETIVRGLSESLLGLTITDVDVYNPIVLKTPIRLFRAHVARQIVSRVARHGKSIFLTFESDRHIKIHLGMSGALLLWSKNKELDAYVRIRFRMEDPMFDLVFRDVRQFGCVAIAAEPFEKNWGPDAWTAPNELIYRSLRKKKGMIKHALMNQNVLAGLGNIYVDETLFDARIHPRCRIERLSDEAVKSLCEKIRAVLDRAIGSGGTTFRDYVNAQGKRGEFGRRLKVYGKKGQPCSVCGRPLQKIIVASRGTHFCKNCQRPPRTRK